MDPILTEISIGGQKVAVKYVQPIGLSTQPKFLIKKNDKK